MPYESVPVSVAESVKPSSGVALADLDGVRWDVTTLDGQPVGDDLQAWFRVSTDLSKGPDIEFEGEADVFIDGNDGCNQYDGYGDLNDGRITMLAGESTTVGCPPPLAPFPSGAELTVIDGTLTASGTPPLVAVATVGS